uniref:Ninja-family protein n=1 Tax=Morus notabilis TaxID=981085 RepID=W8E634_9ROSA|nr:novel interactor of JAZ long variant [Morus notabilis]
MEDENGLELSLGLSCGGLSAKSKGKNGSSSDIRPEEGDRGNKLVDDFKNFLNSGQKQDSSAGSQRSDSLKPKENFFNDLSKNNVDADAPVDLNGKGVWGSNNKPAEFEEEKRAESGSKRRMFFDEMNQQKKHEREAAHFADINDKARASHITLTTEEGSTAENEDVAESEVEGSTSRLVLQHDDGSKRFIGIGGSSDFQKEVRGISDSKVVDLNGQKRFNSTSENGFKLGNVFNGTPFPGQPVNMMNMPFPLPVKEANSAAASGTPTHLLPGVMQVVPTANSEAPGTQPGYPGNLPLMFGYSPVQIPMLDKDNSWGLVSQPQQFHPSFAGRSPPNPALMQVISHKPSEAAQHDVRTLEQAKGDGKQQATEEGSSSHAEEDGKGSSANLRVKDAPDRSVGDGFALEFSAIKPGILADIKFGGSGSCPNLPWVSTTAPGPNGRTISGVTYRYNANQIRIVCACHSTNMSPEEFVRHASEDPGNPEGGAGLATFPNTNPAASAQS